MIGSNIPKPWVTPCPTWDLSEVTFNRYRGAYQQWAVRLPDEPVLVETAFEPD